MADPDHGHQQARDDELLPLYQPSNQSDSAIFRLLRNLNQSSDALESYSDLYRWSTTEIANFWSVVWDETAVVGEKGDHVVDNDASPSDNPPWFSQAKVNWAENMLLCRSPDQVALIQASTSPSCIHVNRNAYQELFKTSSHSRTLAAYHTAPHIIFSAVLVSCGSRVSINPCWFETGRSRCLILFELHCRFASTN